MNARRRFVARPIVSPAVEATDLEIDSLTSHFAIHCPAPLLDRLMRLAQANRFTEVFGLLLGKPVIAAGSLLRTAVLDYVPARRLASSDACYVEVSVQELQRMHQEVEEIARERNLRIVGWFHTHPGHGIFMSATDRDNHRQYTQDWQVALVLDPQRVEWGFFAGPACQPISPRDVVFSEADPPPAASGPHDPSGPPAPPAAQSGAATPPEDPGLALAPAPAEPAPEAEPEKAPDPPAELRRSRLSLSWAIPWHRWRAAVVLLGATGQLAFLLLLNSRMTALHALAARTEIQVKDLEHRFDDLAKRACVRD